MPEEIISQQTFQEKLEDRIRKDIGDLIPDEALAGMVKKAIERAFFEEREVDAGYYSKKTTIPWIVKLAQEQVDKRVKEQVEVWFTNNSAVVMERVQEYLDKGLATSVIRAFDSILGVHLNGLAGQFQTTIDNLRVGRSS